MGYRLYAQLLGVHSFSGAQAQIGLVVDSRFKDSLHTWGFVAGKPDYPKSRVES